ncbi:hypothetical protein MKW92_032362 [Papaver armeniacum]|nr:hypothetical protein MKW92_032362 [Papaver armeniacum]
MGVNRLGGGVPTTDIVCKHWRAGRCTKNPCWFRHSELPQPSSNNWMGSKRSNVIQQPSHQGNFSVSYSTTYIRADSTEPSKWGRDHGGPKGPGLIKDPQKTICKYWMAENDDFTMLAQLAGHEEKKAITGIAFQWGLTNYTLVATMELSGSGIPCVISEGPWVFAGIKNCVKAWNIQTQRELSLSGPSGLVYALAEENEMLLAGTQDGSILVWKFVAATNGFEPAAALKGHSASVLTLVVGNNILYSGSMDNTIRLWSLETLQCIYTLTDHTSAVTSVLCWDQFLLSCSLDKTIKVWAKTESGKLEVTYTKQEEHGLLALSGMPDAQGKPVLMCSCNDNTVCLYDVPSFKERGKICAKGEIRAIHTALGSLFFTGDGNGDLKVWRWTEESPATAATIQQ